MNKLLIPIVMMALISCNNEGKETSSAGTDSTKQEYRKGSFGYDLNFLQQHHKDLVVLGNDSSNALVIVAPAYQGRVMTSTAEGKEGLSFGWVNHELIASGKQAEHINAFGGEERF